MILMLSGEGKDDMGYRTPGAIGMVHQPGAMALIVDRLAEKHLKYSLLEMQEQGAECVRFVSERELMEHDRPSKPGSPLLRGLKRGRETGEFTRNAQVLGLLAKDLAHNRQEDVIAVLFHDADTCDGARWEEKRRSIENGFALAEFRNGVPMVPRPKSEAWLLCALKNPPYQHCQSLENASGNDASPQSLKKQLAMVVGHDPTAQEQADWVREGRVDPEQIDMPSFTAFRKALERALDNVLTGFRSQKTRSK